MCLVEALHEINAEKIALNSVYYWPDWRDGIARFLREAGFEVAYVGNFVDQGFYQTQQEVNDLTWIFPHELAEKSVTYVAEQVPDADAIVINGMPNWRREDGLPKRALYYIPSFEKVTNMPVVSSDIALYWRIFKTLNLAPIGQHGQLLSMLSKAS